jgi:hypothetical protein
MIAIAQKPAVDLFTAQPDWLEFDAIPDGELFFDRRGLAHVKTGRGSTAQLFDDEAVNDDDLYQSVFDDWPYWRIQAEDSRAA